MMDLKEIINCDINLDIAKEAFSQSETMLTDIKDVKKQFEHKASILLSGYLTSAVGLFAVAITRFNNNDKLFMVFVVSGGLLLAGVISFFKSLKSAYYGHLGSEPKMWLNKKYTVEGKYNSLAIVLCDVTLRNQKGIDTSIESNKKKAFWIDKGLLFGIIAIGIFGVGVLIINFI